MSIEVKVYNQKAEEVGKYKLSKRIFGVPAKEALLHQAMLAQMGNERQVLAHVKDKSEVRGGGRKPWRQKGTGRARAGSSRSPIWKGGGATFGPRKDRNFKKNINKKMRQKAMFMVLSDRVKFDSMIVLDKMVVEEFKTKVVDGVLARLEKIKEDTGTKGDGGVVNSKQSTVNSNANNDAQGKKDGTDDKNKSEEKETKSVKKAKRSVLVINDEKDEKLKYSARNLVGVKFINLDNINILDLLKYRELIITKNCIKKMEERYK